MSIKEKTVGVILAAGIGQRLGGITPKQFRKLAGKILIEYTIESFVQSQDIDEIIVVTREEYIDYLWSLAAKKNWKKLVKVIAGGKERADSTLSAINALSNYEPDTKILFHDAVRPFVTPALIHNCVVALESFDAIDVAIPSYDTLVSVNDDGCINDIPRRDRIKRGQTPQAFRLRTIQTAYLLAGETKYKFTCDCSIVHAMLPECTVATIEGHEKNIKITTEFDLFMAEKIIQSKSDELGFQVNKIELIKNKNIVIFGGVTGIGKAIKELAEFHGAHVFVASRSHNNVDVRNLDDISEFLSAVAKINNIDIIINTSGVLIKKPLLNMSPDEIMQVIDTNFKGSINVACAAKPYLVSTKGVLINFSSSSYTRGRSFYSIYSSSKSAVVNFTQAIAEEWLEEGVRVICMNPERTKTAMRTLNFGIEEPSMLLEPEEVAFNTLAAALSGGTGLVYDIKKSGASK